MITNSSTNNSRGGGFDPAIIDAVWRKGTPVAGNDPALWRKDACGAWMHRPSYGKTTQYGWEIDHVKPFRMGGSDDVSNLQPLHWGNNRSKSDDYPKYYCAVRASGTTNVGWEGAAR